MIFSRTFIILCGKLYPAYASFKALSANSVEDYVKWMIYWIVYAVFSTLELFTDVLLKCFPFYHEIKVLLLLLLLPPLANGSAMMYRMVINPFFKTHEAMIDRGLSEVTMQGGEYFIWYYLSLARNCFSNSANATSCISKQTIASSALKNERMSSSSANATNYTSKQTIAFNALDNERMSSSSANATSNASKQTIAFNALKNQRTSSSTANIPNCTSKQTSASNALNNDRTIKCRALFDEKPESSDRSRARKRLPKPVIFKAENLRATSVASTNSQSVACKCSPAAKIAVKLTGSGCPAVKAVGSCLSKKVMMKRC